MLKETQRLLATPVLRLAIVVALANLMVLTLVVLSLESSYQLYRERAAATSHNINLLVSQSLAGEIDKIDMGLKAVVDEHARQLASGKVELHALTDFLIRQQERLPMSDGLRIIDAEGGIVSATGKSLPPGISVADRDYFIALRDNPGRGLVISKPIVGRINGEEVLVFARRLNRPDGRFDGVAIASVTIRWFERQFSNLVVGPHGAVVMRGDASRDFDLLARVPRAGFVGQTKVSQRFRAMITANPRSGTYEAYAGADNIRRTFSYQQVADYPLITLIGLATEDVLAEWWREVIKQGALAAAFVLMSILGSRAVLRAWRARSDAYHQFRLLLTSAGVGIFGIDTNGICTFCNPAATKMLGYAGESNLLGRDMLGLICASSREGTASSAKVCGMRAVMRKGGFDVHVDDEEFLRADGTSFPVEYWAHPQQSQGKLVGAVVTFADIIERKRAEEALKQLNENLEQRVAEEARKNREKDHLLIQQSRLAAMGEMMHNVAHQWRQPLMTLVVLLRNILDDYEAGELSQGQLQRQVGVGIRLANSMSDTIDDFRNFFRPEEEAVRFNLMEAAQEALTLVEASFRDNGIEATMDGAKDVFALGYLNEYSRVLFDVLNNAKDAIVRRGERGKVAIHIAHEESQGVVRIRDNGGGIPADILPKIFDPYFTTKESGTGIGLYMAKAIVENNMGGKIEAHDVEDGAEFIIAVPLAENGGG